MDSTERISQLSHRIFNTTLTEKRVGRTSNPFATPSFTGKIISLDTFTPSQIAETTKMGIGERVTQSTKRIAAAFVAGINNIGEKFYAGIQAVKDFGAKVKESVVSAWNKVNEIGSMELSEVWNKMVSVVSSNSRATERKKYQCMSVGVLSDLLNHHLGKLEEAEKAGEGMSLVA